MSYSDEQAKKPIYRPSYVPAPPIPRWFRKALDHIGGWNVYGDPKLRVVWGMDERWHMPGNPQAIKYMSMNHRELGWACFILEQWFSPSLYDRDEWERLRFKNDATGNRIDYLGEFPARGEYGLVVPLCDPLGEALPLCQTLLDEIRRQVENTRKIPVNNYTDLQRRAAMLERIESERSEQEVATQKMLDDLQEEYNQKGEQIDRLATRKHSTPSLIHFDSSAVAKARETLIPKGPHVSSIN